MNARQIAWNDIKTALAVCRSGSLSGAARTLGVDHSTVFRRLKAIEEQLGVKLFERLAGGYTMTPAGETLLASANRIEDEVLGLERALGGQDLRLSGVVRVTTADSLASSLLPPHLARFHRRYTGIQVELAVANMRLNLTKREADVAIRPTMKPPETLIGRRICGLATALYASPEYLADNPVDDWSRQRWILPDDTLAHLPIVGWLAAHHPQARVTFRSNSMNTLCEAAKAGLGVCALPCFMADPSASLARIGSPLPELATELWVLTHTDMRRTARIHAFIEFIVAALTTMKAHLEGRGDAAGPAP